MSQNSDKSHETARSPDDLQQASGHIAYEIRMFRAALQLIGTQNTNTEQRNLHLEGLLLHMRVLVNFFFDTEPPTKPNARRDDIRPSDFASWVNLTKKSGFPLDAANKRLAHLTWSRVTSSSERNGLPDEYLPIDMSERLATLARSWCKSLRVVRLEVLTSVADKVSPEVDYLQRAIREFKTPVVQLVSRTSC